MSLRPRSILVLGGSYFIGRHIAHELARDGFDVTLLNRGTRTGISLRTIEVDRNDPTAMREALKGRHFDIVLDTSCYDAAQALIAEGALSNRYGRWLFLSTAAAYADGSKRPFQEDSPRAGLSVFGSYGQKKAVAESVLQEVCGERLTTLRPAYVYGPHNNLARETSLWSRMLSGSPVFVPSQGRTCVSFIHVQDLAEVVRAIIARDAFEGRAYNVAHPEWVSFRTWLQALAEAPDVRPIVHYVPEGTLGLDARQYFPYRDVELTLDVSRLAAEIGVEARFDIYSGLVDTYAAYQPHELREMQRSSSVELELSVALGVCA